MRCRARPLQLRTARVRVLARQEGLAFAASGALATAPQPRECAPSASTTVAEDSTRREVTKALPGLPNHHRRRGGAGKRVCPRWNYFISGAGASQIGDATFVPAACIRLKVYSRSGGCHAKALGNRTSCSTPRHSLQFKRQEKAELTGSDPSCTVRRSCRRPRRWHTGYEPRRERDCTV